MLSNLILAILNWLAIIEIILLFFAFTKTLTASISNKGIVKAMWFILSAFIYLLIYVGTIESLIIILSPLYWAIGILLLKTFVLLLVLLKFEKFRKQILMNRVLVSIINEINK